MKKKIWGQYKKIKNYWKSHIWSGPVFFAVIFIIFSMSIVLRYFQQEYIQYLKDETYNSERTTLISASKNLNNILNDFITMGSEFAVSQELLDKVETYVEEPENQAVNRLGLKDLLSSYARYSKWVIDIAIVSEEGLVFDYDKVEGAKGSLWNRIDQEPLMIMYEEVHSYIHENRIPQYYIGDFFSDHPGATEMQVFNIAFPLKGGRGPGDIEYVIVVSMNVESLSECFDFISGERKDIVKSYLSGEDGTILYHNQPQYAGMPSSEYLKKNNLINIAETIGKAGWKLNISIDEGALSARIDAIYIKGIAFFAGVIILFAFVMILGLRSVIRPIYDIHASIEKVKIGDFKETIPVEGSHEIWQLVEEYNKMIRSIDEMTEAVEQGHKEKLLSIKKQQKAEREALESQINSHFICNTLGVINYEVIESGNYKASILLKKLSNILRYTFDQKHQNVYMCQEIMWIEQYLFLQKSRLEEAFDYEIEVDDQFDDWPCRKLMLQPFVENSILHGFEGMESGGCIRITGRKAGAHMELTIADNGSGIPEEIQETVAAILREPVKKHHEKVGIGISNVIARMRMFYGEDLKVSMETEKGRGTRFIFLIPKVELAVQKEALY